MIISKDVVLFMEIIDVKYEWAGSLAKRNAIDMIVLHHADASSCTAKDIHWWHICRGYSGIGYHYFINKKGEIYKGRPDNVIGAHAKGYNSTSIGVCFEGRYNKEVIPQAQLQAGKELVEYLKKKYNITKVKKHKDLMATDCPGNLFPFEEIVGQEKENLILSFQRAAVADGFKFPQYGCDGKYGSETKSVMKKCVVKKRLFYKYKNSTKLVQRLLGIQQDGLCGKNTENAIKNFQSENNLTADGCCGVNTWKALLGID
jgi:hypothetical protein